MECSRKYDLELYVHDCHLEIGHSHALIEMIRNIPNEQIRSLRIVSYTCSPIEKIFPDFLDRTEFIKVPFPNLKPVLLKAIFYHIWCMFYSYFDQTKRLKIGIGVAALHVDLVYIQYLHRQWRPFYFRFNKFNLISFVYKKALYWFLEICERVLFEIRGVKIISLADFVTDFIAESFGVDRRKLSTVHSGINLTRYQIDERSKEDLLADLIARFPQMKGLDIHRPIYLFVGGFERKGLAKVFSELDKLDKPQLLVVGKSEQGVKWEFPATVQTVLIDYCDCLPIVYSLCDCFIFPTQYEPFGLVLIEAAAMGMTVMTHLELVGASEVIHMLDDVQCVGQNDHFNFEQVRPIELSERLELRAKRLKYLGQLTWELQAEKFRIALES